MPIHRYPTGGRYVLWVVNTHEISHGMELCLLGEAADIGLGSCQ